MVTKLKKFSGNIVVKGVVLLLTIIIFTSAAIQFVLAGYNGINFNNYEETDYRNSSFFFNDHYDALFRMKDLNLYAFQKKDNLIQYYYNAPDRILTNVELVKNRINISTDELNKIYLDYFQKSEQYYFMKEGIWYDGITKETVSDKLTDMISSTAYLAFPSSFFEQKQKELILNRKLFKYHMTTSVVLSIIGFFMLLYLMIITWFEYSNKKGYMYKMDKIYTDLLLVISIGFTFLAIISLSLHINDFATMFKFIVFHLIYTSFTIFVILSLVRKSKARTLLFHSVIYKLFHYARLIGKDIFEYLVTRNLLHSNLSTRVLYCRQVILCMFVGVCTLLAVIFGALKSLLVIIPIIILIMVVFWYVKGNSIIYKEIDTGIERSLRDQMKSERTKIALITNVSHDLKTPLTSIISYVDLLSKEEGLSETASDYVKILHNKSNRLKTIVTDLFELAKSSSGDMVLEQEHLDLKRLTEQTLADMEDKIQESGIPFKLSLPDTPVIIKSDGKKLYRVFQNIIDNALKYSLQNTRVYVDLYIINQRAEIIFKNISSYEMNFTKDEILQRFYRGDQSRSTEGSGLGLSIAESFTINCGGTFDVEVDGDVFKVILSFPI